MKIRGRLIIAFLFVTLFPVIMFGLCSNFILQKESRILKTRYNLEAESYDYLLNPYQLLYHITAQNYGQLADTADTHPEKFLNTNYTAQANKALKKQNTFLVLRKNRQDVFIGNKDLYSQISSLPSSYNPEEKNSNMIYMDQSNSMIIRKKDFYFSDGSEGQLFLIADVSHFIPRWHHSIRELLLSYLLIILITALLLIAWIYRSIVYPLNILRIATRQIGAGNLNQPIQILSTDEIGELCQDFEEMRIRLKNMIDGQIQYDEDTRTMLSSISHDLKTPLTAIRGYTEGLMDGVAQTPEMQEKYLHTIYNKAGDMTYLVEELSLFAQMEQDALTYHFTTLKVADYFADCMEDLTLDIETMGLELSYYNNAAPDTRIYADPEQLKRVIYNIANNAGKYMDHTPSILHVRIEEEAPKSPVPPLYRQLNRDGSDVEPPAEPVEYIKIQIEDEGPGIDAKDLPHIFDQFYRADASRNSSTGGSGLGLSIVKKIITDHGGKVWAESISGVGTSINFLLKKAPKD